MLKYCHQISTTTTTTIHKNPREVHEVILGLADGYYNTHHQPTLRDGVAAHLKKPQQSLPINADDTCLNAK